MNTFFDSIVDIYDETRGFPEDTMDDVIDVMVKEIGIKRRVLDLGVGTARFAYPLQMQGINVVGLDLSSSMMSRARGKGTRNLILGDACIIPFSDSSFDHIISIHILHLVEDFDDALKEITRVGTGKLISVLFTKSDFNPMEEYKEALSLYGYDLYTPGPGEKGLKDTVKPHSIVPIPRFKSMLSIHERIKLLAQRKHSFALETPKEIHNDAIRYLRKNHEHQLDMHAATEIEVIIWRIKDILRYVDLYS
jgi:ubiquinone/menaquinone biosynthesis C-methylase UbiE